MSDDYTTVIFNCQDCTFACIDGLMTNLMCPPKEITIVNAFFETKQPNKASLLTPTHEHLPPRQFNSYKSPYDCGHHLLLLLMSWLILLHYLLLVHSSQPTTTHPVPALPSFSTVESTSEVAILSRCQPHKAVPVDTIRNPKH